MSILKKNGLVFVHSSRSNMSTSVIYQQQVNFFFLSHRESLRGLIRDKFLFVLSFFFSLVSCPDHAIEYVQLLKSE